MVAVALQGDVARGISHITSVEDTSKTCSRCISQSSTSCYKVFKKLVHLPPGSVLNSASAVKRSISISGSLSRSNTRLGSLARTWTLYMWSGSRLVIVCWNVPGRTVLWRAPSKRISWLNELLPGDHSILADVGDTHVTCTWLGAKFASGGKKSLVLKT